MPPLGIMVETPAAAVAIDLIPADFFSIGSNDLTQYVMAASRDGGGRVGGAQRSAASGRAAPDRPGGAARRAHRAPVSLCGDMASDPAGVAALLGLGLRRLSVAPAALGAGQAGRGALRRQAMAERAAGEPGGDHRRLQVAAARLHRAPALGPARPARHGAGQAQELRLADRQPGLHGADPGRRPADHLRHLPSLAAGARRLPGPLPARPSRAQRAAGPPPARAATSCASPCPSSAREATAREVEALILDFASSHHPTGAARRGGGRRRRRQSR